MSSENNDAPKQDSGNASTGKPKVAFITNIYNPDSHADKIGTKLFLGMPTDEEVVKPELDFVSMWIDQVGSDDIGSRIAGMNGVELYPTIADALTLGGDTLAVDAVVFIGEHGEYPRSRLGVTMYPRMNFLEQMFRVFDASARSVPVFSDKYMAYSWLDSKWIYDRASELNVPMMAGSSLPFCWRDPMLEHSIGTEIREAVGVAGGDLDSSGIHVMEMIQCMVERRTGGETGVKGVQGLQGEAVWEAIDAQKISSDLVEAACDTIDGKPSGAMREVVTNPTALRIEYLDGLVATLLILDEYVNAGWAYAALTGDGTVASEFVLAPPPKNAHFSYLALNIQKFIMSGGQSPVPIERNLLTNGIMDMGFRSMVLQGGNKIPTPFLDIEYSAKSDEAVRAGNSQPTGQSLGENWPPEGYEFIAVR